MPLKKREYGSGDSASICMAAYNGELYICEQIESILQQMSIYDELIIVDDRSTDRTISIIQQYTDHRIKILINKQNSGPIKSFERALRHARNKYIFLADQDDIWMPEKLDTMIAMLKSGYDLVVSDAYIMTDEIIELDTFYKYRNSRVGLIKNYMINSYIGCCMGFRSSFLKVILPFPENIVMHDLYIGMSINLLGRVVFVDERLIVYRRHENNVTSMSHSGIFNIIKKRWITFKMLIHLAKVRYNRSKHLYE